MLDVLVAPSLLFLGLIFFIYSKSKLPIINLWFGLLVMFTVVGLARNNNPTSTDFTKIFQIISFLSVVFILYYFFLNLLAKKNGLKKSVYVIVFLGTCFIILNYILYMAGFRVKNDFEIGPAVTLSSFGIHIQRVLFPLGGGFVSYGEFAGGIMVIATALWFFEKSVQNKFFLTLVILLSTVAMLLVDSRSVLFSCVFSLVIFWMAYKRNKLNLLLGFVWLIPIYPLLFFWFTQLISDNQILESIQRNENEMMTGNGRLIIWGFSFLEFSNPKLIHLFGYGDFGQYISGASANWAPIFKSWDKPEMTSPHNTFIQLLFNYGYIGTIIFLVTMHKIFKTSIYLIRKGHVLVSALLIFLIQNILIGIFGSVYFWGHRALFIFLAVLIILLILKKKDHNSELNTKFA